MKSTKEWHNLHKKQQLYKLRFKHIKRENEQLQRGSRSSQSRWCDRVWSRMTAWASAEQTYSLHFLNMLLFFMRPGRPKLSPGFPGLRKFWYWKKEGGFVLTLSVLMREWGSPCWEWMFTLQYVQHAFLPKPCSNMIHSFIPLSLFPSLQESLHQIWVCTPQIHCLHLHSLSLPSLGQILFGLFALNTKSLCRCSRCKS